MPHDALLLVLLALSFAARSATGLLPANARNTKDLARRRHCDGKHSGS